MNHDLTNRETQVLEQVAAGDRNKQIARLLGISDSTVKSHIETILTKLDVPNRAAAVAIWASRQNP